jgi:Gpi18-like mannosyltransferase
VKELPGGFSERGALARAPLWGGLSLLFLIPLSWPVRALSEGTRADRLWVFVLFALLFAGALGVFLLCRRAPISFRTALAAAAVLAAALLVRAACLDHRTNDYDAFLSHWVSYLRAHGGFSSLATLPSDYNVPYLYLLSFFAALPLRDLYLIKFASVAADVLLAFAVCALGRRLGVGDERRLALLALVLMAPTVWLNSAFWAQCDAMYTLFVVLCLHFIVGKRPGAAMSMAGLALAFKLQAVFFFPVLAILLFRRRIRWVHALWCPGAFFAVSLPALFVGRPLVSLFSVYYTQMNQYSQYLNLNAPSLFAWLPDTAPTAPFFMAGIACAALFALFLFYRFSDPAQPLPDRSLAALSFLCCVGLPWMLPSMHERYFYMADVFSLLYVMLQPRRWYLAPLTLYASYAGYHAYLFQAYLPFSMWLPALLLLPVVAHLTREMLSIRARAAPGPAQDNG